MKKLWLYQVLLALLLCTIAPVCNADSGAVSPATMDKYQKAKKQIEELGKSSAVKYAPEMVAAAHASMESAQNGLKSGVESQTLEAVEMAILQAKVASALVEERIAAEKAEAAKRELSAFEKRLSAILSGKGDMP